MAFEDAREPLERPRTTFGDVHERPRAWFDDVQGAREHPPWRIPPTGPAQGVI